MRSLLGHKIEAIGIGLREGDVSGAQILTDMPIINNIHTLTLYLNAKRQKSYYDYIVTIKPQRVIFNPGTKNAELELVLTENDIFFEHACTLVLLSTGQY